MTPLSHSLDSWIGNNENLSAIASVRLGLKRDGGEVFKVNLYKARCAATAVLKERQMLVNYIYKTKMI